MVWLYRVRARVGGGFLQANIHFISGLPRSGSTLLAALLRQNPRFSAGLSSPLHALFSHVLKAVSSENDLAFAVPSEKKEALLRGLFDSWLGDTPPGHVAFDTNRLWTARLPALTRLFPQAKVICCIRDVAWILDSIERLIRRNAFELSGLFIDDVERATVYSRCEALASRDRLIGLPWHALKEAYWGEHADRLLLVEYDFLAQAPEAALRAIYDFIGEPWFPHDFGNVTLDEPVMDEVLRTPGLHAIRPRVAWAPRRSVLPPDLLERYGACSFWDQAPPGAARLLGRANAPATAA
ncbi:MAG: sulfotransferase [Alphaproteobacteria bacterium]|nr:sulfotransferase [Alphaproteobacteria bacterium]